MLKRIRDLVETALGFYVDRGGEKGSIILTKKKFKNFAYSSYRCQCQAIIEQFNIDLVIDAGANEGQFAKNLRRYYSGEIHSFEPVQSTFQALTRAAHTDKNWRIHQFALGSKKAEQTINVSNRSEFSSLFQTNTDSLHRFGEQLTTATREHISIRRLDDVLLGMGFSHDNTRRRIFLKMDTQGYDLEVFRGLGNWIHHVYALQSELSVIPIYDEAPHWTDCILEFEKAGSGLST